MAFLASVHGSAIGAYISTLALAALHLFGIGQVNLATGILHFSAGLGAFAVPPFVGYLFGFELPGESLSFIPCMAFFAVYFLAFLFFVFAKIAQKKHC